MSVPNSANPRKIEFYDLDASALTEPGRKLLREYSGIPDAEINSHVEAMVRPILQSRPQTAPANNSDRDSKLSKCVPTRALEYFNF
jgi:hypothetical protein